MNPLITDNLEAIRSLCRDYCVLRLDVFGSATTGGFDAETSDVDFVVTFANARTPGYADRYLGLSESLELLLGHSVDLVVERAIRNHYFREAVEASRRPIYDATDTQTAARLRGAAAVNERYHVEQYAQNGEKQAAVERWLMLIGEA